ncbi:MAG: hypothetical protein A2887_06100 [Alphaproteobacteria bacterium RIFCSPLOWO2_01_FULL_40_26]|nr:MAG: hypothetical protein A3D15_04410 [Alphaproteobacteria bacterium RIFCSPHIGHO2_02_FULL_40_34]OFW85418.1 MAG: hypothetical protein A2794_05310 [Alphaproteobacteria bacterium RIFCSPHIGHO2_01_FULL_40_8]OFW94126.1 MAG: hypothetical protein A2887_06100 [Alphaproteobacteria bacterium RIFCSPLOWO2_01_FULL_40_26]OFX09711.1 MAG: hypothetical protein A3H30_06725 [Alphaproteobacteria bacterium RIFCSPLOWO2_02_FULL_40_19]OFX11391.1 MAG: hypothetical protein A3G22_06300 [Alphaproteobacteria bacterium RI
MKFRFDVTKNSKLIEERGISFEQIIDAIEHGNVLATEIHHNIARYPNQYVFHIEIKNEVYSVPFVIEENGKTFFLKTIFPSRKARKKFLEKQNPGFDFSKPGLE